MHLSVIDQESDVIEIVQTIPKKIRRIISALVRVDIGAGQPMCGRSSDLVAGKVPK